MRKVFLLFILANFIIYLAFYNMWLLQKVEQDVSVLIGYGESGQNHTVVRRIRSEINEVKVEPYGIQARGFFEGPILVHAATAHEVIEALCREVAGLPMEYLRVIVNGELVSLSDLTTTTVVPEDDVKVGWIQPSKVEEKEMSVNVTQIVEQLGDFKSIFVRFADLTFEDVELTLVMWLEGVGQDEAIKIIGQSPEKVALLREAWKIFQSRYYKPAGRMEEKEGKKEDAVEGTTDGIHVEVRMDTSGSGNKEKAEEWVAQIDEVRRRKKEGNTSRGEMAAELTGVDSARTLSVLVRQIGFMLKDETLRSLWNDLIELRGLVKSMPSNEEIKRRRRLEELKGRGGDVTFAEWIRAGGELTKEWFNKTCCLIDECTDLEGTKTKEWLAGKLGFLKDSKISVRAMVLTIAKRARWAADEEEGDYWRELWKRIEPIETESERGAKAEQFVLTQELYEKAMVVVEGLEEGGVKEELAKELAPILKCEPTVGSLMATLSKARLRCSKREREFWEDLKEAVGGVKTCKQQKKELDRVEMEKKLIQAIQEYGLILPLIRENFPDLENLRLVYRVKKLIREDEDFKALYTLKIEEFQGALDYALDIGGIDFGEDFIEKMNEKLTSPLPFMDIEEFRTILDDYKKFSHRFSEYLIVDSYIVGPGQKDIINEALEKENYHRNRALNLLNEERGWGWGIDEFNMVIEEFEKADVRFKGQLKKGEKKLVGKMLIDTSGSELNTLSTKLGMGEERFQILVKELIAGKNVMEVRGYIEEFEHINLHIAKAELLRWNGKYSEAILSFQAAGKDRLGNMEVYWVNQGTALCYEALWKNGFSDEDEEGCIKYYRLALNTAVISLKNLMLAENSFYDLLMIRLELYKDERAGMEASIGTVNHLRRVFEEENSNISHVMGENTLLSFWFEFLIKGVYFRFSDTNMVNSLYQIYRQRDSFIQASNEKRSKIIKDVTEGNKHIENLLLILFGF